MDSNAFNPNPMAGHTRLSKHTRKSDAAALCVRDGGSCSALIVDASACCYLIHSAITSGAGRLASSADTVDEEESPESVGCFATELPPAVREVAA
jgi:hypothetical protein